MEGAPVSLLLLSPNKAAISLLWTFLWTAEKGVILSTGFRYWRKEQSCWRGRREPQSGAEVPVLVESPEGKSINNNKRIYSKHCFRLHRSTEVMNIRDITVISASQSYEVILGSP